MLPGGSSTVDQSAKVYWVTPGDGTVSLSWLMLGITISGVCFGATALTAIVFLCCCQKKEVAEDV